ncbi:MAG: ribonuclease D, partial [Pseudomonadota bacterium]
MGEIHLHRGDLPADVSFGDIIAVDTEAMGLDPHRDALCVVQLSTGDGTAHLVQLDRGYDCPQLKALLTDPAVLKIFHYARFDLAMMKAHLGIDCAPVWCTKIA